MADCKNKTAIGIDLGTTYCCVGAVVNGEVKIFPNVKKNRTTPSWVAFTQNEYIVGEDAVRKLSTDPKNVVYNIKRIIGKKCEEPTVKQLIEQLTFRVENDGGKPLIRVLPRNDQSTFTPEEISGMVLKKMKEVAERFLGNDVHSAVITIPASFSGSQRLATQEAAAYAGLNVLRLLTEPVAAAIAYGFNTQSNEEHLLVFDFGGGTLDVSILAIEEGTFDVKATSGSPYLGGQDLDNRMVNQCINEYHRQYDAGLETNDIATSRLRLKCEEAKIVLSTELRASVEVKELHDGNDFTTSFSRVQFERMNQDLFELAIGHVKEALTQAQMENTDIDKVILAGGSSRIPRIQSMLIEYFGDKLCNSINPDEAIAYGAAIDAAHLSRDPSIKMLSSRAENYEIRDITPLSLGIEVKGRLMSVIIPRGHKIPADEEGNYTTFADYQTNTRIAIYEGERTMTSLNDFLKEFVVEDIPRAFAGVPEIKVYFKLDKNGILQVSAEELSTRNRKKVSINYGGYSRCSSDIQSKIIEASTNKVKDEEWKRDTLARNKLELYTRKVTRLVSDMNIGHKSYNARVLMRRCGKIMNWIGENNDLSAAELEAKYDQLVDAFDNFDIDN